MINSDAKFKTMANLLLQYHQNQKGWRRFRFISFWALLAIILGVLVGALTAFLMPNLIMVPVAVIAIIYIFCLWAMPDFYNPPLSSLGNFFFLYIYFTILWPEYIAFQLPGLWLSPPHLAQYIFVVLALYCSFSSDQFRNCIRDVFRSHKVIKNFTLTYFILLVISIPISLQPTASFSLLIKYIMSWMLPMIFSMYYFRNTMKIEKIFLYLIYAAIITSLIGILEFRKQHILWMNWLPAKMFADPVLMYKIFSVKMRDGIYRAQSTFSVSLTFAEYLGLIMPVILYFIIDGANKFMRTISVCAYFIVSVGIYVTGSRLGIIAFIGTHGLYLLLWSLRRVRQKRDYLVNSAVLTIYPLVTLIFFIALAASPRLQSSILGGHGQSQFSNEGRAAQWRMSRDKILHRPIGGYGLGQSGNALGFRNPDGTLTVDSYFLTLLMDLGIPGLIAYVGIFMLTIFEAIKVYVYDKSQQARLAAPLAVCLAVFLVIKSVLSQTDNHPVVFMMLGMTLALVTVLKKDNVLTS